MPAIETDGLTRRFGDVTAVEDLSLTVEDGEVFGFLGPNGAGKSTTINVLLGFLEPTSGTARVLGHDVTDHARDVRRRIGLLPEGFAPYRNLTGREHVRSAIDAKSADDDPDDLLDRVGLDPEDARRAAGDYSTGMTRRLGLAIALAGEPDLLVLDEPSGGLDPNGVKRLRGIVREEAARGATVFFSSHILDEVEKVCDRVGVLTDGTLVAVDTIEALRDRLGAGATVSARLDSVPGDLALSELAGVSDVTVEGRTVRVAVDRPDAKMPTLRRLDDAATVEDILIEDASLEEIFDEMTEPGGETDSAATAAGAEAGATDEVAASGGDA